MTILWHPKTTQRAPRGDGFWHRLPFIAGASRPFILETESLPDSKECGRWRVSSFRSETVVVDFRLLLKCRGDWNERGFLRTLNKSSGPVTVLQPSPISVEPTNGRTTTNKTSSSELDRRPDDE